MSSNPFGRAWRWLMVAPLLAMITACVIINPYPDITEGNGGGGGTSPCGDCDDQNECTNDACVVGVCEHIPRPQGTACQPPNAPAGQCDDAGVCVPACNGLAPGECDDGNVCTQDTCVIEEGRDIGDCAHNPLHNVLAGMQVAGDCLETTCVEGATFDRPDDGDVPDDTECQDFSCISGQLMTDIVDLGTTCETDKFCNEVGACVQCVVAGDCAGILADETECVKHACVAGVCENDILAVVDLVDNTVGDCMGRQCDGMGIVQDVNRDTDVNDDGNECTIDACNSGTPTNTAVPDNTGCGVGSFCANGVCGCTATSQCPADTFCRDYECTNNACVFTAVNLGMPLPPPNQTAQDCRVVVCDAQGNGAPNVDNTDVPADGNVCTEDVCVGGIPGHPPSPLDAGCGASAYCDGNGSCVACNSPSQCTNTGGECAQAACTNNVCGTEFTPAGTNAPNQTSGDCQVRQCDGMGGINDVTQDNDVPNPSEVCEVVSCSNGMVQSDPATINTACSVPSDPQLQVCDGASTNGCVECNNDLQCPAGVCDMATHKCQESDCSITNLCTKGDQTCIAGTCDACESSGPAALGCPPECTSCQPGAPLPLCKIACQGAGACAQVKCPAGFACEVTCRSALSCGAIECAPGYPCETICSVDQACQGGEVVCGPGANGTGCGMHLRCVGTGCDNTLLRCSDNRCSTQCDGLGPSPAVLGCNNACECQDTCP